MTPPLLSRPSVGSTIRAGEVQESHAERVGSTGTPLEERRADGCARILTDKLRQEVEVLLELHIPGGVRNLRHRDDAQHDESSLLRIAGHRVAGADTTVTET